MLRKMFYIAGGLFLSVALLGSIGFGAWTYKLNNQLEKSQADYAALQSRYDKLNSEYSKSKAEYSESKADYESRLNKAQAEVDDAHTQIKNLERSVDRTESENKALRTKISAIQSKVAVLYAFWFTSESSFAHRVDSSDDEQLKGLYQTLQKANSWDAFRDLMSYLIQSISETSGIGSQSTVNAVLMGHHG